MKKLHSSMLGILLFFILTLFSASELDAAVHFISKKDNLSNQTQTKPCILSGYNKKESDCTKVGLKLHNLCPSDSTYGKLCACDTDKFKYDTSNCSKEKKLSDATCGGKYEKCDCDASIYKYFSNSDCPTNQVVDSSNSCTYIDKKVGYSKCVCPSQYSETCTGNLVGVGTSCGSKYSSCKCQSNFIKCSSNKGAIGSSSCVDAEGTKFTSCLPKSCEAGSYLSKIPNNNQCSTISYNGLTCFKDCKETTLTCPQWVQQNHPTLYNYTYFENKTNVTLNYKALGPKHFDYAECQKMATPTITSSNTKNYISEIDSININFTSDGNHLSEHCSSAYDTCKISYDEDPYTTDFDSCIGWSVPEYNTCYPWYSKSDCCLYKVESLIAGYAKVKNAILTINKGTLFHLADSDVIFEGNVTIKTSSAYAVKSYRYNSPARGTLYAKKGSNVIINGNIELYTARFEIEEGANVTVDYISSYNGGRDNFNSKSVHIYGTLYAKTLSFINAPVKIYNKGKLRSDRFYSCKPCSGADYYLGKILYDSGAQIQIGNTCRRMTSSSSYSFQKEITSNPLSGGSCP